MRIDISNSFPAHFCGRPLSAMTDQGRAAFGLLALALLLLSPVLVPRAIFAVGLRYDAPISLAQADGVADAEQPPGARDRPS